jgi:predicted nucleotide-binding protein (sugar kinase/HSP70/actin superfamily)
VERLSRKIGIPRTLMYFDYFPMWKSFFNKLGLEVILSEKSNKNILSDGIQYCVNEACLPIKIFHGHVNNLIGKVDYIFIPRLKSLEKGTYTCPKFCGLPEMVKYSLNDLPPIIDTEFNLRKNEKKGLLTAYLNLGFNFTKDKRKILKAFNYALGIQSEYERLIKSGILPSNILDNTGEIKENYTMNVALIGQGYTIYDKYISMDIINKLGKENINVITPELVEKEEILKKVMTLHKEMFWSLGKRVTGAALHYSEQKIDGFIFLMSFGCGIGALLSELCEKKIRKSTSIPFIMITIDEHTSDIGFNTRIEAFIDMLKWRKNNESYISANG